MAETTTYVHGSATETGTSHNCPDPGSPFCPICRDEAHQREIDSLRARLATAEAERAADTARLDWLERERPRVGLGENGEVRLLDRWNDGSLIASEPTFREAIDAATRRAPSTGGTP